MWGFVDKNIRRLMPGKYTKCSRRAGDVNSVPESLLGCCYSIGFVTLDCDPLLGGCWRQVELGMKHGHGLETLSAQVTRKLGQNKQSTLFAGSQGRVDSIRSLLGCTEAASKRGVCRRYTSYVPSFADALLNACTSSSSRFLVCS